MNNIAVINKNIKYSYIYLYNNINYTISLLNNLNITRKDRVIIFANNSIETVILLYAINKIGAIFTIFNTHSIIKNPYIFMLLSKILSISLFSK